MLVIKSRQETRKTVIVDGSGPIQKDVEVTVQWPLFLGRWFKRVKWPHGRTQLEFPRAA